MIHAAQAQQGHKYDFEGREVVSMASGLVVVVRPINGDWLGDEITVKASWLKPLPMKYFGCETPEEVV